MKDPITLPREVVEGALKALERASRQLTDEHKMVLNGKSWAEADILALRQSLASAPQEVHGHKTWLGSAYAPPLAALSQEAEPPHCQKCGGEVHGWICQLCGQDFEENDAGKLVFMAEQEAEPVAWRKPTEVPDVKPGDTAYRIVAVRRAHSSKVYSFAAFYLNQVPLFFEDYMETRHVTGWNSDEEGDEGPVYKPLLGRNDELMGWREFPVFPDDRGGEVKG